MRPLTTSTLALFLYDYLLTLDREIRYIWTHVFCTSSAFFLLLRYSYLVTVILGIMDFAPVASKTEVVRP